MKLGLFSLSLSLFLTLAPRLVAQETMGQDTPESAATQDDEAMPTVPTARGPEDAVADSLNKKPLYDSNNPNFRDIAKEFRCPTCTGLSVLESDAGFSVQIKEQVQEQLNLGKNHDQIVEYFVTRYGAWILREPPVKGFNALAWIIPIALLVLGPVVLWLAVWKRRAKVDSHGVRSAQAILAEMQENLQRLKRENG